MKSSKWNIIIILSLTVFIAFFINPVLELPLYDDWSFSKPVKNLTEGEPLQFTDWTSMNLITNVLWGYLFTLPDGFSFTALRISTIAIGIIGLVFFYLLAAKVLKDKQKAFLATLFILFNPYFLRYQYSFNTDVVFLSLAIISLYFFSLSIERDKLIYYLSGIFFAIAATLSRQPGLLIPLVFGIAYLVDRKITRSTLIKAILPILLVLLSLFLYARWLDNMSIAPKLMDAGFERIITLYSRGIIDALLTLAMNIFNTTSFLGLFTFPLLILNFSKIYRWLESQKPLHTVIIILEVFIIFPFAIDLIIERSIPFVFEFLLFPLFEPGVYHDSFNYEIQNGWYSVPLAVLLYFSSVLTILTLIVYLKEFSSIRQNKSFIMILLFGLIYSALIINTYVFNKYLIVSIPAFVLMLLYNKNTKQVILITALSIFGLVSVLSADTNLTRYKARENVLNILLNDKKVKPKEIDGWVEFNAWHFYDYDYEPKENKSWYWVQDDKYKIRFREEEGYRSVYYIEYGIWLPPFRERCHALKRIEDKADSD